jgi:hypothetical protein
LEVIYFLLRFEAWEIDAALVEPILAAATFDPLEVCSLAQGVFAFLGVANNIVLLLPSA